MWAIAAVVWLVRLPPAWPCGCPFGLGPPGISSASGVDAAPRALLVAPRFGLGR
ncbi:MAG: hypothetical protein M3Q65_22860 [Chloroflexota bacterium]|nr:hypothetical protein [Chloroflexota bacterium]